MSCPEGACLLHFAPSFAAVRSLYYVADFELEL
jgi:hypothetical protein